MFFRMYIRRSCDGEDWSEEDFALHDKFVFHPRISSHLFGKPRGCHLHWEVGRGLEENIVRLQSVCHGFRLKKREDYFQDEFYLF